MSAGIIGILTLLITAAFYMLTDPIISLLNVPEELTGDMHTYLVYVFTGFSRSSFIITSPTYCAAWEIPPCR